MSGTSPLCIGATATYSTNGTSGGNWASTNTAVATVNAATGLVTAATAGTTNITYTVGSGCGSPISSSKTLTVSPNVTAGTVSGTSPLCIGATATYTSTGTSGGSWSSTNTFVATVNAATGLVTTASAGSTNITYTVSSGCGSPVSSNSNLIVSPNVTAGTVSGTTPLCAGTTATYNSNGTSGGNWASTNTAVATVNASTGLVTAGTAGTTNITYTVSSGCGSPASSLKTLTVSTNVTAGTVSGTSPLCIGATATYSSTGTSGGSWSSSNTFVATVNAVTGLVTAASAGSTNITYTINSGCGSPASSTKSLTVSLNVTSGTVSGTSPLCIGATATYSSNGTSGGNWSSTNPSVATVNAASGLVTPVSAGTTGITYTVSSGCASPVSSNKVLTVSPPVTAGTVSGTSPLCIGTTALYSSDGTSGGSWTSTNTAVATVNASTGLVTAVSAGTTNISYTLSSGCGSPVFSIYTLTVDPGVTPGNVSGTSLLCIGATATYSSDGTSGGSWSSTNTAVAAVTAGAGLATAVSAGTTNITYTVSSGCGSPVSSISKLTVISLPDDAGSIAGKSTVCRGETGVAYSVATIANATGYSWTLPTGASITGGTNTNSITVSFSAIAASGNITVTGTNECGNGAASTNLAVTVNPLPDAAGSITGSVAVCQNETGVTYSVPPIANATGYTWTLPAGATITDGVNTNSITVSYSSSASSGNSTVTGTNACGNGTTSSTFAITVNDPPVISNFTPVSGVVGSSVAINGSHFNTVTSVLFNGVSASFVIDNDNRITATVPAGATTGLISVTNPCGTSNSSTSFIVTASTSITLNLRIFLEGFYRGNSSMAAVADPSGHPGICDTISVVLHTATPPYEFVAKVTSVVDTSGNGIFVFTALPSGFYYIGVIHRSSVETWSKNAVFFDLPSVSYDFTSPF